jgi:ATP-dependent protease Clp ATPase subunit
MRRTSRPDEYLRCSFCHKSQEAVAKLIASPAAIPRAYICDECVAVCASILEDEAKSDAVALPGASDEPHPLLSHPLISRLLTSVEDWVRQESLGNDASEAVARVRSIAARMFAGAP